MITDYFKQRGLKVVPEVTDAKFSMIDDGAVEVETGEFLYGFMLRLKPFMVLSTGTYTGISDLYIAQALKENGFGGLTAVELDLFHIKRARQLWEQMGVSEKITSVNSSSLAFKPFGIYEAMFLDTEPQIRFQELVNFYPFLAEGGYVFIHDTPRSLTQGNINPDHPEIKSWPFGDCPDFLKTLVKENKLSPFYFGGARGLLGLYKRHKEDYL